MTNLHDKQLTSEEQAQAIADIVHRNSPAMNSTKPVIEFSYRPTKRRLGCCYPDGRIRLCPDGQNWGLLAHELAHLNSENKRGHGYEFQSAFASIWETMQGMAEVM